MGRPRRIASPTGVPFVTTERALQVQVVRGILTGALTITAGAAKLEMPVTELSRIVVGARRAVIASLGEGALEAARRAEAHAQLNSR